MSLVSTISFNLYFQICTVYFEKKVLLRLTEYFLKSFERQNFKNFFMLKKVTIKFCSVWILLRCFFELLIDLTVL